MTTHPHGRRLLVALVGSPLAWTLHLFAAYAIVALWCANGWGGVGAAIGVLTALCAAAAVGSGALAVGLRRHGQAALHWDPEPGVPEPWDARLGERGARAVFLSVVAVFMAVIFTLLIVLQGLPPLFTPACPAGTVP